MESTFSKMKNLFESSIDLTRVTLAQFQLQFKKLKKFVLKLLQLSM